MKPAPAAAAGAAAPRAAAPGLGQQRQERVRHPQIVLFLRARRRRARAKIDPLHWAAAAGAGAGREADTRCVSQAIGGASKNGPDTAAEERGRCGSGLGWGGLRAPGAGRGPSQPALLSSKLEIQAEILNHRRYTDITERYCMTHSDTGQQNLTVKSVRDFSLL